MIMIDRCQQINRIDSIIMRKANENGLQSLMSQSVDLDFLPEASPRQEVKMVDASSETASIGEYEVKARKGDSWSQVIGSKIEKVGVRTGEKPVNDDCVELKTSEIKPEFKASKLAEEVQKISNLTDTRITISHNMNGISFIIQGRCKDNRRKARRRLLSQISHEVKCSLEIPATLLGKILGQKGQTVQRIQMETGSKIEIARDTTDKMVRIDIRADKEGLIMAKSQIHEILGDQMPKYEKIVDEINWTMYPWFLGPFKDQLDELRKTYSVQLEVPTWLSRQNLRIIGEKHQVEHCFLELKKIQKVVESQQTTFNVPVSSNKIRFLLSTNGVNDYSGLEELFQSTQCVLEIPQSGSLELNLKGYAPLTNVTKAFAAVVDKLSQVHIKELNLASYTYSKTQEHAEMLAQYLLQRGLLTQDKISPLKSVLQVSGLDALEVDDCFDKLENTVLNLGKMHVVKVLIPTEHRADARKLLEQDFDLLEEQNLSNFSNLLYFDKNHEETHGFQRLQIRRQNIGPQEILQRAAQRLQDMFNERFSFESIKLKVESKYHDFLAKRIPNIYFGTKQYPLQPIISQNEVLIRGNSCFVEEQMQKVYGFLTELRESELEPIVFQKIMVPAKYLVSILGKHKGLITKFDCIGLESIIVDEEVVITGTQKAVDYVSNLIDLEIKVLEDMTLVSFNVPQDFHKKLIGEKGKNIKKLELEFKVKVSISKTDSVVQLNGPSKQCSSLKEHILSLVRENEINSFKMQVSVDSRLASLIIGKSGSKINLLREMFSVRIDCLEKRQDACVFQVLGKQKDVEKSVQVIKDANELMKAYGSLWLSLLVPCDKNHFKKLLMIEFKAPNNVKPVIKQEKEVFEIYNMQVSKIPLLQVDLRRHSDTHLELRSTQQHLLDDALIVLKQKILNLESEITICAHLPYSYKPYLFGKQASNIKALQQKYECNIQFNSQIQINDCPVFVSEVNEPLGAIYICGPEIKARDLLSEIISKAPYQKSVFVPLQIKEDVLGRKKEYLKYLKQKFNVRVSLPLEFCLLEQWTVHGTHDNVLRGIQDLNDKVYAFINDLKANRTFTAPLTLSESQISPKIIEFLENTTCYIDLDESMVYAADSRGLNHLFSLLDSLI